MFILRFHKVIEILSLPVYIPNNKFFLQILSFLGNKYNFLIEFSGLDLVEFGLVIQLALDQTELIDLVTAESWVMIEEV